MKKSLLLFAAMFIALFVTGCSQDADKSDEVYDNAAPTDLSDVIEIYEKHSEKSLMDFPLEELMYMMNDSVEYVPFTGTSYAIDISKYADSDNGYLANAGWFFNVCAYTFNIWSNHEMFIRDLDDGTLLSSTEKMNSKCISNDTLRTYADKYKEQMINLMKNYERGNTDVLDTSYGHLEEIKTKIEGSMYKFTDSIEVLLESMDTVDVQMEQRTEKTFKKYLDTPEDERLIMMLNALNDCKTFDDQCSLLMNWANCKESESEDMWIIGVSERLLNSKKYNPELEEVWVLWRALKQSFCYGLSRDSNIPNDEFNEMRKKCYLTVLDRVERHPDDKIAMACASNIAGRYNMNRYGRFYFGNESSVEMFDMMPARYEDILNNNDEEENDEESTEN